MTEQKWLTSSDPEKMLQWVTPDCDCAVRQTRGSPVRRDLPHLSGCRHTSDRKLRLFACACARQVWNTLCGHDKDIVASCEAHADGESIVDYRPTPVHRYGVACPSASRGAGLAVTHLMEDGVGGTVLASILRDIIGNPFRPVTLPVCRRCDGDGKRHGSDRPFEWTPEVGYPGNCLVCNGVGWDAPYRTPTVVALATAAYQDRGRVCGRCDATGKLTVETLPRGWQFCPHCEGKGRHETEDGALDNDRLAVLADALSDAGCPEMVECEKCHYGWVTHFEYRERVGAMCGVGQKPCPHCGGVSSVPNPILAHLRSEGPHARGCWVIDLLLGKS